MRPMIGILLDYQAEGSFSSRPHNALRCAYFDAVSRVGGLPVGLGYVSETIEETLDRIDGLILPGGFYDFPARFYGEAGDEEPLHPRAAFEIALINAALERNMPLLGICAGMQALGAIRGGVLYRNLHDVIDTDIDHLNERPAEETAHSVSVSPGTLLHAMTGVDSFDVNTAHSEAFATLPDDIAVSAVAPDGVIEAIELPASRFAVGIQWHPEFFQEAGNPSRLVLDGFVSVAGGAAPPAKNADWAAA